MKKCYPRLNRLFSKRLIQNPILKNLHWPVKNSKATPRVPVPTTSNPKILRYMKWSSSLYPNPTVRPSSSFFPWFGYFLQNPIHNSLLSYSNSLIVSLRKILRSPYHGCGCSRLISSLNINSLLSPLFLQLSVIYPNI